MEFLEAFGTMTLAALVVVASIFAGLHVMMTKDDVRSALAWIGFVLFVPIFGPIFYLLFGINRVTRQAVRTRELRGMKARPEIPDQSVGQDLGAMLPEAANRWRAHSRLASRVARRPITAGNEIEPLEGGRPAYDKMIEAINGAKRSVALTTYIFQADQAGRRFVTALKNAHERGVEVRVLVDSVGNLYGLKPVMRLLKRHGVPVASFNSPRWSWRLALVNLRTHRKLLVVDGEKGFAGGMNIRAGHLKDEKGHQRIRDTHFAISGPVVGQMLDAFSDDWLYTTGEDLAGDAWTVAPFSGKGEIVARSIADGPDEKMAKTSLIIASALSAAREKVEIITPYFVPDKDLVTALMAAAMRGVDVRILVPEKSNLPLIGMAAEANFANLLNAGCRIFQSRAPFDHSKLANIDDSWVLFGSSNWDARSLRLNFEFNIETIGPKLAGALGPTFRDKFSDAKELPVNWWKTRSRLYRVVSKLLWLNSPYL